MLRRTWPACLALVLGSCVIAIDEGGPHFPWSHSLRGSGVAASEERSVGSFHAIELDAAATVRVRVGEATSLRLAGDDNLLAEVETEVDDGVLTIDLERSCSFRQGLEIEITTPSLDRFEIDGSGDVVVEGVSGARATFSIEGSGELRAGGSVADLEASIEGSGHLDLDDLAVEHARVSIEGSGSIDVQASHTLHYDIEGSGSIRCRGSAELRGQIVGSGSIEKRP